jgi:hypothetical protein
MVASDAIPASNDWEAWRAQVTRAVAGQISAECLGGCSGHLYPRRATTKTSASGHHCSEPSIKRLKKPNGIVGAGELCLNSVAIRIMYANLEPDKRVTDRGCPIRAKRLDGAVHV